MQIYEDYYLFTTQQTSIVFAVVYCDQLPICILAPRGAQVPAQVYNNNDGTFRVEYPVQEVGT